MTTHSLMYMITATKTKRRPQVQVMSTTFPETKPEVSRIKQQPFKDNKVVITAKPPTSCRAVCTADESSWFHLINRGFRCQKPVTLLRGSFLRRCLLRRSFLKRNLLRRSLLRRQQAGF